jgi:PHD/YefM family antitoxin component YafN of YafNO toxin-antitoxin module
LQGDVKTIPFADEIESTSAKNVVAQCCSVAYSFLNHDFPMRISPIFYPEIHAADIVSTLNATWKSMLILQNGETKLVVIDVPSYEEQEQTIHLLQILACGRREIAGKRVVSASDAFIQIEALDGTNEE